MKFRWKTVLLYLGLSITPLLIMTVAMLVLINEDFWVLDEIKDLLVILQVLWIAVPCFSIIIAFIVSGIRYSRDEALKNVILQLQLGNPQRADEKNDYEHAFVNTAFNHLVDFYETRIKEMQRHNYDLNQSNERYRIITDYTKEIIFDWNFETDEAEYSFTWWKKFGYDPVLKNLSVDFAKGEYVHPDDLSVFREWLKTVYKGRSNSKEEFRFKTVDDEYYWVRVRTVPVFNQENEPVKLVGLIQDIDDSKKKEDELIQRADFDYLSQLYNRSTFEIKVNELIESKTQFALMYVDIDDFRMFNTRFGHEFGDRVIQFIGTKIHESVGDSGFAGRVGGDEFIFCLTDEVEVARPERIAEKILAKLKTGLPVRESIEPVSVQCSIGIVFFPKHGSTLEDLSSRADKAMYEVKHSGKYNYIIVE